VLLNLINNEKDCHKRIGTGIGNTFQKQYWYWHRRYLIAKVLLLVLTTVFTSIVNVPDYWCIWKPMERVCWLQMSFSPAGEANSAPSNPLAGFEKPVGSSEKTGKGKGGYNEMKERDGGHERKTPPETKFTDIVLRYILRHIIKSF